MNYQEFQTCVRAFFPGIKISHKTASIELKPHNVERFTCNMSKAITELYDQYHLTYGHYLPFELDQAYPLIIWFYSAVNTDGDHVGDGIPFYSYTGWHTRFYMEEDFMNLLKIASHSGIFDYDTEPEREIDF